MATRSREIQVGLIFILAVAMLIAGVLWFKEFRIGGQTYLITVEFENTSGLQKGDPVEVRGVTSGQVAGIDYEDGRALVRLSLDKHVSIYPESRFVIENVGIMGQKLVAIHPGPVGEPLPSSSVFQGEYQRGIPSLMADMGSALDSFDRLANRLESLLQEFDDAEQGSVTRILNNTERLTEDLADFLGATRGDLTDVVENFKVAMGDLHAVLDGRSEDVATALDHASRAASRLDSTLVVMESTLNRTDRILAGVENGEGTLGLLAQDPELYNELRDALEEAQALMSDLKENPRKYLKFSVF